MQNPGTLYHVNIERSGRSRYAAIAFVGAVHAVLIYALVTGLAGRVVESASKDLIASVVPPPSAPVTAPKPQVTLQKPEFKDTVPVPKFDVATPPAAAAPVAVLPQPAQTATAPVAPSVPGDSGPVAVDGSHSTPPYPPLARRLGQQGTVTLQLAIGADGSVQSASVVESSGSPGLDQAAADWVMAHWRYKPAIQNGAAVASSTQAKVRFDLSNPN